MWTLHRRARVLLFALLAGAALLVGWRAGAAGTVESARPVVSVHDDTAVLLPATRVINIQNQIALLDTTNGSVYLLQGDLKSASPKFTWKRRVLPVDGQTSGYLQLQKPPFAFDDPQAQFLVDIMTGRTWILRQRGIETGSWDEISFVKPYGGGLQLEPS